MKIERQKLLETIEIVKPGLASKEFIEQSTSFAFQAGKLITFNDEISVSHPIDLDIEGTVKAEELHGLLSKMKGEVIDFDLSDDEVQLKCGKFKAGLKLDLEVKLPLESLEGGGKWYSLPDDFIDGLSFAKFSASKDMTSPVLTCLHVDGSFVESSDNYRITRYALKGDVGKEFLIPATVADQLCRYSFQEVSVGKSWVHFRNDAGTVFSVRTFSSKFPEISGMLDIQGVELKLPRKIQEMLDRASILAKRDYKLDEEVLVKVHDNKFIVRGQGEVGWSEEEANVRYSGDPILFKANPDFLKAMSDVRECVVGERVIKFQGENWQHLIALHG